MIKIKAVERKAGFGKTSKTLWYPAIHLQSDVTFEEFIELVADETTVSSADIKAVFDRAAKVLIRLLQDAKSVDCGDLGTFRPSITAKTGSGVASADKVGVELVDKAKVIYTPRVKVKSALKGVRLERASVCWMCLTPPPPRRRVRSPRKKVALRPHLVLAKAT